MQIFQLKDTVLIPQRIYTVFFQEKSYIYRIYDIAVITYGRVSIEVMAFNMAAVLNNISTHKKIYCERKQTEEWYKLCIILAEENKT